MGLASRTFCIILMLMTNCANIVSASQHVRVIRNDAGGNVNKYLMDMNIAILSREVIHIDGWCASACTLYLASPDTCVTDEATFAFHAPRGGTPAENQEAAKVIGAKLPEPLSDWYFSYAANLEVDQYVTLTGAQIVQMKASRFC